MLKSFLIFVMNILFFNRFRALIFCISFMLLSLWTEIYFQIENFFSASGTLFTVAGLFLNIKLTAIFHLKQMKDGKAVPLNTSSKHILATNSGGVFASTTSEEEKRKKVEEVESDEVYGICFMIFGTALWGYGSYFTKWLSNLSFCI